jgi:hypothetical protein
LIGFIDRKRTKPANGRIGGWIGGRERGWKRKMPHQQGDIVVARIMYRAAQQRDSDRSGRNADKIEREER